MGKSALSDETTDKVSKTILHTVLYVANELLNQRAMLLPHVSQVFLKEYFQSVPEDTDYTLEEPECTIKFSSKWLLKKLLHTCTCTWNTNVCIKSSVPCFTTKMEIY